MCTSLTLKTKDGKHLLARTMDFSLGLDTTISYMPKNYEWKNCLPSQQSNITKYGFIGAGKNLGDKYYFADGVNEKGLGIAELYFPGKAKYHDHEKLEKRNVAPQEIPMLLLGSCASLEEVKATLANVHIVDQPIALLGVTPPLHYIISDRSGNALVLETNSGEIEIKENKLGVMTNSPELEWHIQNMQSYIFLTNKALSPQHVEGVDLAPFGQGSGSFGLPGGYTPPERFVRTAFLKQHSKPAENEAEAISSLFHILHAVDIPKGAVIHSNGNIDYTQYISAMCFEETSYYFKTYENPTVYSAHLADYLEITEPFEFNINQTFQSVEVTK